MSSYPSDLPLVVVGAGPIGLAAAAHLIERGNVYLAGMKSYDRAPASPGNCRLP